MTNTYASASEGDAIANYSRVFRRPEGLFLAFPNQETMEADFLSFVHEEGRKNEEIDLIIVSDGEQILGIGGEQSLFMAPGYWH